MSTVNSEDLYGCLISAASKWSDREFLVIGDREQELSFSALLLEADRFGKTLYDLGVQPGDRVAIAVENSAEWLIAAWGAFRVGAVVVGLNTHAAQREMAHYIRLCRPRVLLLQNSIRGRDTVAEWLVPSHGDGETLRDVTTILLGSSSDTLVEPPPWAEQWELLRSQSSERCYVPSPSNLSAQANELAKGELRGAAVIMFTSGTTSLPKGVVLRHSALKRLAETMAEKQGLSDADAMYSVAPFFHCSGFMHGALTCMVAGARLFSARRYSAREMARVVQRERITVSHGSAGPMDDLAANDSIQRNAIKEFRAYWGGGTRESMRAVEKKLDIRMCKLYGLTETGGNSAISAASEPEALRIDTDGLPLPGVEIKVLPVEGGLGDPADDAGEIVIRGWNLMSGYFRDPQATRNVMSDDGWFRTGDLGRITPDGRVVWLSRIKDVIRVSGENVASAEIEEVLISLEPNILEAAVVACPDSRRGEVPVAFVKVREGCNVTPESLAQLCKGALADFKLPRRFIFVSEFPKTTATNRIQKDRLRRYLRGEGCLP